MGLLGALIMGGIVYAINAEHGFWAAIPAALKQATYTMLAGGLLSRLTERLALGIDKRALAYLAATCIPSLIAVTLTFGVHLIRGTPEPFNSTIPTMLLAPPSFFWWGWRQRKNGFERAPSTA